MGNSMKKHFGKIFAYSLAILFSTLLCRHAVYANWQHPSYEAPKYMIENGAPPVDTVSLITEIPASWLSVLSGACVTLIVLLSVFLILWSLASLSASRLPEVPDRVKATAGQCLGQEHQSRQHWKFGSILLFFDSISRARSD